MTYNHEDYISDALESFIMQKTNFNYEVLVHDDASTDSTAEIVKRYAEKYPDIIKPIFQKENQYSQSVPIGATFVYPLTRGKYFAFCEGDDYWTDPYKLQKQFDALEKHPEIDICTHATICVDAENQKKVGVVAPYSSNHIFSVRDVIYGNGGFVATNSIMISKKCIVHPAKFSEILRLDYVMQIKGTLRGGMLYLGEYMSAYRVNAKNSWTQRMNSNPEKYLRVLLKIENMLQSLDEETNYQYTDVIQKRIRKNQYNGLMIEKSIRRLFEIIKNFLTSCHQKRNLRFISKECSMVLV